MSSVKGMALILRCSHHFVFFSFRRPSPDCVSFRGSTLSGSAPRPRRSQSSCALDQARLVVWPEPWRRALGQRGTAEDKMIRGRG